jgi:signal transduction histidine kinase
VTAVSLPPQSKEALRVGPKAAAELGLIPDLMDHVRARSTRAESSRRSVAEKLEAVERAFGRHRSDTRIKDSLEATRTRFLRLAEVAGDFSEPLAFGFAAELFAALAIERPWNPQQAEQLAVRLSSRLGIAPEQALVQLCVSALHAPQLLELPPALALETQLAMLVALSPEVVEAGLWTKSPVGRPRCLVSVGKATTTRRAQAAAARVLQGEAREQESGAIRGIAVRRWQTPWGALVIRLRTREAPDALLAEAVSAMTPILERELLLDRSAAREHSLVQAGEKRLARFAFDLHDGALQHVAALGIDVSLLRHQLLEGMPRPIVAARTDDLQSRGTELERVLRELAHSLEPRSLIRRPLVKVLEAEVDAFAERTAIDTTLRARGNFELMTPSQKIAVIRVVQEALANIREHTDAKHVEIRVTESRGHIQAQIRDDGEGFTVARTLLDAAKRGRLGLVGSSERLRLLGGTFDVQSKPGGPTTVSLSLPRWQPLEAETPLAASTLAVD